MDPRVTPVRADLASQALEGLVRAPSYVTPRAMTVIAPVAGLHRAPDPASEQMDQILFGESFQVLDEAGGWAWGQATRDGYVGYVASAALGATEGPPTHRVAAIRTYAFAEPSIKSRARGPYPLNALVRVDGREGRLVKVAGGGWFVESHLSPVGLFEADPVAVAERFLGAPYLWGGRDSVGLDCSGLIQAALLACGQACPRDTDQQAQLGEDVSPEHLARGDLVFWKGHVAIMTDPRTILHANAHHMAVAAEPLAEAVARIEAAGSGPPTGYRRL